MYQPLSRATSSEVMFLRIQLSADITVLYKNVQVLWLNLHMSKTRDAKSQTDLQICTFKHKSAKH